MAKVAQSLPYKRLCKDYMLSARLILIIDELLCRVFFLYYFVICLLIKITLILGPQPSKHDYVLCGVNVMCADVPKAA